MRCQSEMLGDHKGAQPCCLNDRREDKISDVMISDFEREIRGCFREREIRVSVPWWTWTQVSVSRQGVLLQRPCDGMRLFVTIWRLWDGMGLIRKQHKTSGLGQFSNIPYHIWWLRDKWSWSTSEWTFQMNVPNGCSECMFQMDAVNRWKALNIPLLMQRWQMFRSWVIIFSYIYTDSENMVLVWSETITNLHYLCNPDDISVLGKFQLYWLLWMFLDDPNARELIGTRDSVRYGVYFTIDYWTAVFWISQKWHLWLLQEDVILSMWEEII